MDLRQIHTEDMLGPSLRWVWISRSKVKGQGYQGQKTCSALRTPPPCGRNGAALLQITSRKQQARWIDRCRGMSSLACVVHVLGLAGYRCALPRISSFVLNLLPRDRDTHKHSGPITRHEQTWKTHNAKNDCFQQLTSRFSCICRTWGLHGNNNEETARAAKQSLYRLGLSLNHHY